MTDSLAVPAPAAGAIATAPRGSLRNAAIGLIALAVLTGTAARYVLSPMQELVRADLGLGLGDNQVALLQGMAIALPIVLISIPHGRLVDRTNRTRLLIMLALVCAAGSVLTALAHDFATAIVARMLVGAAVVAAQRRFPCVKKRVRCAWTSAASSPAHTALRSSRQRPAPPRRRRRRAADAAVR